MGLFGKDSPTSKEVVNLPKRREEVLEKRIDEAKKANDRKWYDLLASDPVARVARCLTLAGLPPDVAQVRGRTYRLDTLVRYSPSDLSKSWRKVFWGRIEAVEFYNDSIIVLYLSHDLFVHGNRTLQYDVNAPDKGWHATFSLEDNGSGVPVIKKMSLMLDESHVLSIAPR